MSKPKLGIDVDGVLVDTLSLYKEAAKTLSDPLDFWRSEDLYDTLLPIDGSVEKIAQLGEHFDIVFVSRLKGNHHRSKVYWCKKWFPRMIGFVGTHEKWILNEALVAMIDDLEDNLKLFDKNKRVLYGGEQFKDWKSLNIKEFCGQYL